MLDTKKKKLKKGVDNRGRMWYYSQALGKRAGKSGVREQAQTAWLSHKQAKA